MTERRIIKRVYNGFERYVVQWKLNLFWCIPVWRDNPPFHVGNNYADSRDDWGYYFLEGAEKALDICNGQEFSYEEVVK